MTDGTSATSRTTTRWVVVLAALVVLAAAALVWVLRDSRDVAGADVTAADAADAAVASSTIKESARRGAATGARVAYSYSWKSLSYDKAAARRLMTPAMRERYDRTMAGVTTSSRRDRTVVEAEVVDTAVVTASQTYARVLVFVNQRTSGRGLERPRRDLDRVLVTVERVGGDWLVSELDAL
jgi:Mce-associated membrane protein